MNFKIKWSCKLSGISFLIFVTSIYYPQTQKTYVETVMVTTELNTKYYDFSNNLTSEDNSIRSTGGFVFGYSVGFEILKRTFLEFGSGILIGDTDLIGLVFGVKTRAYITDTMFLLAGFHAHQNFGSSKAGGKGGDRSSESRTYIYPGIMIGKDISKRAALLLGFYYSAYKDWRNSYQEIKNSGYYNSSEKLGSMFKLVFEYEL